MTNGHWAQQEKDMAQAKILYAQGKIQEADYLLGAHLHSQIVDGVVYSPNYIPVNERESLGLVTNSDGTVTKKAVEMSASETSTWYYVKKPSGICVRTKLKPSSVKHAVEDLGWIVSLTDICEQETPSTEPTPPILSSQIQKIIDDWYEHKLILPLWFTKNNLNWVISGHITESEFLKGFNEVLHEGIAYYVIDHHPTPITEPIIVEEPEVPEQMEFLCSDVYTLDNGSVVKTNYPTLSVPQIQNFISQGLMVRDCGTPSPTVNEVRSHYGYVPEIPVEEVPEVPEETTADIPPPTTEEPEQMEFLCSDVYTLDNGSVVKTNYPTLSVPQIQNFISQGLMVRECGTPSPTVNEVRSHYGYVPEPEETVTTEKFVVSKPGRLTISDMTNTNAWVGVLIAGTLAVPVFSSILSKNK